MDNIDNTKSQNAQNAQEQTQHYGGPVFEPEPGWGKRLKDWVMRNPAKSAAIVIAVIAVIVLLAGGDNSPQVVKLNKDGGQSANIAVSSDASGAITETVQPGDGYTLVARRAIEKYSTRNPQLNLQRAEKIFLEDGLSRIIQKQTLEVGDTVTFNTDDIEQLIEKYSQLTPYQIRVWDWYARKAGL